MTSEVPTRPVTSNVNQVHSFSYYFLQIHFNIICSSTSRSPKRSLSFAFLNENFISISDNSHVAFDSNILCVRLFIFSFFIFHTLSSHNEYALQYDVYEMIFHFEGSVFSQMIFQNIVPNKILRVSKK
jgi:hypothetical protein